ncbi:GMC family oxidoreductase [Bradyrhizobium japonicum]|uniref:GMC family oxidoreductase n=1 Tax=Bradyrhizobium japonicum TaxID=375 RepID=UPI001BA7BBAF|nr:GMC family oxidoreductase N-terminal domain-containing protein [Bradyrhizobium japonicum]MBR0908296.1 GMC family oxidoreductase N-terminal domain-containing protein [Bradyrhizobium japonicum]
MSLNEIYDYVIVGAGSAGCVLASRLTEDTNVRVALVEAGEYDNASEIHIPAAFPTLFKTKYDWDYNSEPEPALGGRSIYLPRGKTLGGSSSINAMVYVRGNRKDYDEWAQGGATGWSYDELLPYFIKAEDNERGANRFHGAHGPLTVQDLRFKHPLMERFVEAASQVGHSRTDDFNGESQDGVGFFQVTQRNGTRLSTAAAYLHPITHRPNLDVFTDMLTTRVILDGRRATGIEVYRNGQTNTLLADREVILCAGAYNSPQLLMLSGIGIPSELQRHGIQARHDLPVGDGLQDHPWVVLTYFTDVRTLFGSGSPDDVALLESGRGPLTSNLSEAGGFFRTVPGLDAPDLQLHAGAIMYYDQGLSAPFDHAYSFGPNVLKPTSRGKVTLRSARPDAKPRILSNLLATQADRDCMVRGVQLAMNIAEMPALTTVRRAPHIAPKSMSEGDISSFIEKHAQVTYHPTSTCQIGRVVDSHLRVIGLDGLRVVDASVMPSIVRGNTNAPVVAIAEKASDLIIGARTRP